MRLLSEADRQTLRGVLAEVVNPVTLVFFTQTLGCETCPLARQILDELVSLASAVVVEEVNLVLDKDRAADYHIERVPAIAVVGERDYGIRFFGAPAGYEFSSLVEAILMVSRGQSGLSERSRALVAAVDKPTAIQVFVTPT